MSDITPSTLPIIGTQYYRPPFPRERDWEHDIAQIRESGLNTVQLWVVWAWVEPEPDKFVFDDFDVLIDLAEKNGLGVVLSTVAAIHPYWIHHEVPGSEMLTNEGHRVISTNRRECHFGLTPGGCIDHPGIWTRMENYFRRTVKHFRDRPNVRAWDIWNELRWNVHADGLVCYCDHTIGEFRSWLEAQYGNLENLNRAWDRRYASWSDVLPGKRAGRTYTEMMAFEHFISNRSVEHARKRYQVIKQIDPQRPATLHGGKPTVLYGDDSYYTADQPSTALHRGNDWSFSEFSDAVGCSSFPIWEKIDLADFASRLDFVRSACNDKPIWLSELQGGMSALGFTAQEPVPAAHQQRWLWIGLSQGADTILFWQWRDELFGKEAGGFGMVGRDGHARQRTAGLRQTATIIDRYRETIKSFSLDTPRVGIWFSPQGYYLYWAQDGTAEIPMHGIQGYARALVRNSIPYRIIEEEHLEDLQDLKVLFMPRANVLTSQQGDALKQFVSAGGILVIESECGAYDNAGLYHEPQDRVFSVFSSLHDIGRRPLVSSWIEVTSDSLGVDESLGLPVHIQSTLSHYRLPATQWQTPFADGKQAAVQVVDTGVIIALSSYSGDAYYELATQELQYNDQPATVRDFERFVVDVATAGHARGEVKAESANPDLNGMSGSVFARAGNSDSGRVIYCLTETPEAGPILTFSESVRRPLTLHDIINDHTYTVENSSERLELFPTDWGVYCLVEE